MTDIVTLADTKTWLRIPDTYTTDDDLIQGLISSADDVMRQLCGDVVPSSYDEYYDGGDPAIYLRHVPVLSVTSVVESWGYVDYDLTEQASDTTPATAVFAYSVDIPATGKISRRTAGNANIPFVAGVANVHVIYTAGRSETPAVIQTAAKTLIGHWYRNELQRSGGDSSPSEYSYQGLNADFTRSQGLTSYNLGVPNAILAMVQPYRRKPIIG